MQDGVIPLFSRDRTEKVERKGGWSNQDLAELYRIEGALVQSGIMVDTELGETDEGDPWFAFCHAETGEVLVHVAVIDGEYHIAGATSSVIVKGYSFTDIVRQFMTREPAFLLGAARHNNVMIHPSSVLIAVFAAICLISDEHSQEFLALSAQDKTGLSDAGRAELDIFNIADQRHIALGEYTFSPQQVLIILSAIAFSASPVVQNNSLGLETAMGVFDLIENGAPELEQHFEAFVSDLWETGFGGFDPDNKASREYAQALSEDQVARIEANAEDVAFEAEQPLTEMPEEGDGGRSETLFKTVGGETVSGEDQPVVSEQELVVQTEPTTETETAVVTVPIPVTAYEFFEINAVITEASEEVVFMIDTIEAQYVDAQIVGAQLNVGISADLPADGLSDYRSTPELTIDTTQIDNTPVDTTPPLQSGIDSLEYTGFKPDVAMSQETYQEISYYFNVFTDHFGDAKAAYDNGRWLVKNDAADEYGWYTDRASDPIIHLVHLDDGTKVYFMGIHGEPGYYDTIA